MLTNWPVSIWYEFLHKRIFETEMWILIPIILRNMFNLHTKKIYSKYDKICVFEKCPHENYHGEKKSWAEWPEISVIQQKHALTCPGLYRLIFQSLYATSLISPRWQIDETVHFRNFHKLFTNKCATYFGYFGTPFSNEKKRNEVAGHMKHAAMAVS